MGIGYGTTKRMRALGASPAVKFDDFLSASIGEERNGRLSVLSMLGRLDLDPWQEARQLANLPIAAATRRLASLIESLPGQRAEAADSEAIAATLVARLPRRTTPVDLPEKAAAKKVAASPWLIMLVAALAILTGVAYLSPARTPPTASEPPAVGASPPE